MDFGRALALLKESKLVARKGWNGKHMFLFLSFPHIQVGRINKHGVIEFVEARKCFRCNYINPTICMKTADNMITVGWLASQVDLLSDDWIEIEYPAKPGKIK